MSTEKLTIYDQDGNKLVMSRANALIQVASGKATFEKVAPIESATAPDVMTTAQKPKPKPKKVAAKKKA